MILKRSFRLLIFFFLLTACGGDGSGTDGPRVTQLHPSPEARNVPVGAQIQATFSAPVDPGSLNQETFVVGGILGKVTYEDQTATFTPAAETPLERGKEYHVTLTTGIKDLGGASLSSDLTWSFMIEEGPDTTRPRILSILPAAQAEAVSARIPVVVVFSEPMDPPSVTDPAHFFIKGSIPGEYFYDPKTYTVTFLPSAGLAPATTYSVYMKAGAKDLAGNSILEDKIWSFRTRGDSDADPPQVEERIPGIMASDVAVNSRLLITFDEGVRPSSLDSRVLLVDQDSKTIPAGPLRYTLSARSVILYPVEELGGNETYQVIVKAGIEDLSGNRTFSDVSWFFTTGKRRDTAAPFVVDHYPKEEGIPISVKGSIAVQFNEPVDPAAVLENLKVLKAGAVDSIPGVVAYDSSSRTARFTPSARLEYQSAYTVFLTDRIEDLAGNRMPKNFSWTFTTVSPPQIESHSPIGEGVSIQEPVTVFFSQPMNKESLHSGSLAVRQLNSLGTQAGQVSGTVRYDADRRMATYTPDVPFSYDTAYQVTLTTEIQDANSNPLESPFSWKFKTEMKIDPPPAVAKVAPTEGMKNVPVHLRELSVQFDQHIDASSLNGQLLVQETNGSCCLPGTLDYRLAERRAVFSLAQDPLLYGTSYTVVVGRGVRSPTGVPMASDFAWTFTTEAGRDATPPSVQSTLPVNGAAGVPADSAIRVLFTEAITPSSVNSETFQVEMLRGETETPQRISGQYRVDASELVFRPDAPFIAGKSYRVTITAGTADLAGNPLDPVNVFSFTIAP